MENSRYTDNRDDCLDIFGQQPGLRIYTQICICFPAKEGLDTGIVEALELGLQRLHQNFPWTASQVITMRRTGGQPSTVKFAPLERTPRVIAKDLRKTSDMTMDHLRRGNFPIRMLDESIVAPRRTFPGSPDEGVLDSDPVFLLQASFIVGGLLLTFAGHHAAMDMTGQGQLIRLFSKACGNERFTAEELRTGNLARRNIIPLLDQGYKPGPEIAHQIVQDPSNIDEQTGITPPPLAECTWANFTFSASSLGALKKLAIKTMPGSCKYVSTDDALTALIWQSVQRARMHRFKLQDESTLARAVDPRRYLGIPETYPGLVQNMTYHTYKAQQLLELPLGAVAAQLREAVDPKTSKIGHQTRALATLLDRMEDKTRISVTASLNLSRDLMFSSWSKLDCYELDFSLGLGSPEAVRRPRFTPVESLIYSMPKALDGEIVVAICLRNEDMEQLRFSNEFQKYARYDG